MRNLPLGLGTPSLREALGSQTCLLDLLLRHGELALGVGDDLNTGLVMSVAREGSCRKMLTKRFQVS